MGTLSWGAIATLELIVLLGVTLGLAIALCRRQRQQLAALRTLVEDLEADQMMASASASASAPAHFPDPATLSVAIDPSPVDSTALSYADHVEAQIAATRSQHFSLTPDRDIVLDIAPEAPLERQALALRHAFLIAEKEAVLAGADNDIAWDMLQAKLSQIIQYYGQGEHAAGLPAQPAEADNPPTLREPDPFDALLDLPLENLDFDSQHR